MDVLAQWLGYGVIILPTWIALVVVGWLCWPLGFMVGASLPDRGYVTGKILGLWAIVGFHWFLSSNGLRSTPGLTLAVAVFVGAAGWWAIREGPARERLWEHGRTVLALELVCLFFMIAGVGMRSWNPAITWNPDAWGAEKFTDFAWFMASRSAETLPPQTPWLSGTEPNYYYLGHLVWALLFRVTGFAPEVDFNLALATLLGLSVLAAFMLGWSLTRRRRWGALAVFLLVMGGNLDPWIQLGEAWGADDLQWFWTHFDWWRSSRPFPGAINEFPAFSFLLADLHAHVSALPLTLTAMMMALHFERGWWNAGGPWHDRVTTNGGVVLGLATTFALLACANAWDVISLATLAAMAAIVFAPLYGWGWGWDVSGRLALVGAWVVLAVGFATKVFIADATSPSFGPVIQWEWAGQVWEYRRPLLAVPFHQMTPVGAFLTHYGLFLAPIALATGIRAASQWRRADRGRLWFWGWAMVAVALALTLWTGGPLVAGLMMGGLIYGRLWTRDDASMEELFTAVLGLTGVVLALAAEFFFIPDIFVDTPDRRINTVFKLHYFIWTCWALAAVGAWAWLTGPGAGNRRPWRRWAARGGLVLAVLLAGLYPVAGLHNRYLEPRPPLPEALTGLSRRLMELDGLHAARPWGLKESDLAAIQWLREQHPGNQPIICEAYGPVYTEAGRIATFAGGATPIVWDQHLSAWRGPSVMDALRYREIVVHSLYRDEDFEQALAALAAMRVDYVVVGPLERATYGTAGEERMQTRAKPLFQQGLTRLWAFNDLIHPSNN